MVFDVRAAKMLALGESMPIEGFQGLRLAARESRKTWLYRYRTPDGGTKQVSIGQWPTLSLHDAIVRWQALRDLKASGVDPKDDRKAKREEAKAAPAVFTVRVLVERHYKALEAGRKPEGAAAARRSLERLLDDEPAFASKPAAEVSRSDAYDVLERRKATPTAAAKLRSMLATAWDEELDAGKLGEVPNWWRQVQRGKLKSKGKIMGGQHVGRARVHLTLESLGTLLPWADEHMHQLGRDVLHLYLRTGTRGAEILGMLPEHVRQEKTGLWWTIPKALTKNAHLPEATDLRIPLIGEAGRIMTRRVKDASKGVLFAGPDGEPYTQHRFSTYIYDLQPYSAKAKRRQGSGLVLPVTGWTPHNLRRTARTLLASLGCPNEIGEAVVGHMPAEIIGTYNAYTYDAERLHWLAKLGEAIDNASTTNG
jgi:integrase